MIELVDTRDTYIQDFTRLEKELTGGKPSWFKNLRKLAISRFQETGFPTDRDEDWRFTDLGPIVEKIFKSPEGGESDSLQAQVDWLGTSFSTRLVFVNGCFSQKLSTINEAIEAKSLALTIDKEPARLEPYLDKTQGNSFAALNSAFFTDGAFIHLPKGQVIEQPIHIVFISNSNGHPTISHPRILIIAGQDSKATIVQSYVGVQDQVYHALKKAPSGRAGCGLYFTNSVTEIFLGENSSLESYKFENESQEAFHVANIHAQQKRSSNFTSHTISASGAIIRNDLTSVLSEEGAGCTLNGLYLLTGAQHVDNHTTIDHAKPHCASRELYKGVLDGKSRAVFNGKIIVRPDAQKTDAMQTNKNLMLSEGALVNTKPVLEIFANDVKCKHGATIGQISQDMMFYLKSRGLDREEARRLLIYAFTTEMIRKMSVEQIRNKLEELVLKRYRGD